MYLSFVQSVLVVKYVELVLNIWRSIKQQYRVRGRMFMLNKPCWKIVTLKAVYN